MGKETQTFKCRKDTDKIWQSFMIKKKKPLSKLRIEWYYIQTKTSHHGKLIENITLKGKRLKALPPRSGTM
jgi:hypothetical protein